MTSIHDPRFDVPARPMYRWGTSPFHARGVIYRETLAMAETLLAARGTSVAEVLHQHGDAALEAFMSQRFAATEWYDMYPVVHFGPMVARAVGMTVAQHMRTSALMHAEEATRGFTAIVLKLLSNETVASWLPRISGWYHDFGRIETRVVGERHVRGARFGLPVFAVQGWSVLGMHFTEHVLTRSGAKDPRAHVLDAEPDGERDGCPLYRVAFEVRWS